MRYCSLLVIGCLLFVSCKKRAVAKYPSVINPMAACDSLSFDLNDGTINGVAPTLPDEDIKEWFPCYSSFTPYGADSNCSGAIFYKKYDFYYYTARDFVKVKDHFKGKVTQNLMGRNRIEVVEILGKPARNKAIDSANTDLFPRKYGCLQVNYTNQKVTAISAHYNECETLDSLCH